MNILKKPKLSTVILIIIALILTAVTATLSFFLYDAKKEKSYYDIKCESFSVANANLSKGQMIFIGDSITDLYKLDAHYSSLPLAAYNRGISGDNTSGVLKRLETSVFALEPSNVVLMIGTNDMGTGQSDGQILEKYEKIVKEITERLPEARLFCMSVIPQNYTRPYVSKEELDILNAQILRINSEIEAVSEKHGAEYIDLHSHLTDESGLLKEEYTEDGLHLDNEGFEVWTRVLLPRLKN